LSRSDRAEPPRRALAAAGAGLALLLAAGAGARAQPPALELHNVHTGEWLALQADESGRWPAGQSAALSHLLRDHRDGLEHDIDPALLDLLLAVAERCQCAPRFEVISGFRSPATNAALRAHGHAVSAHSLHMAGRAIDVRLAGCALPALRAAGIALARGGVGYYPAPGFVHLDTGRVRSWTG
jgi:uncharacterized protein YcbK (DUF882 family)